MKPRSFTLTKVAVPLGTGIGADNHEHGRGGDLLKVAGLDILERQALQAGLAVAVCNSVRRRNSMFGIAFSWVMR